MKHIGVAASCGGWCLDACNLSVTNLQGRLVSSITREELEQYFHLVSVLEVMRQASCGPCQGQHGVRGDVTIFY